MLAFGLDLLSGRYVATAYNDRDRSEWPPHPARLFSALVATWADGEPASGEGEAELQALRWLEHQVAPDIVASSTTAVGVRDVVPVFVPVNDVTVISAPDTTKLVAAEAARHESVDANARVKAEKDLDSLRKKLVADTVKATSVPAKSPASDITAAAQLFPERRVRQSRTFPSLTPTVPTVIFVWPDAMPTAEQRAGLGRLLVRMVRLGHTSSFVHARIVDAPAVAAAELQTTRFVRDSDHGSLILRWVADGQVDRLMEAFARHRETEPRVLPAMFVRYREGPIEPVGKVASTVFDDDWIVLARVGGPRLPSTATAGVAKQLRHALMSFADQPVSELLSGHRSDGSASAVPHLAVVPLPFVGSEHADGALLGVGLVLPRSADPTERQAVLRAIGRFEAAQSAAGDDDAAVLPLRLGSAGVWHLQRVAWGEHKNTGLRPLTWSRPARQWATATPMALDRNPGDLHDPDPARRRAAFDAAAADVVEAVRRIGVDAHVEVEVVRSCVLSGSAKPRTFPRFPSDAARAQRVLVHVRLVFAVPVRGPILLGAGRYHGLGLCRPVDTNPDVLS